MNLSKSLKIYRKAKKQPLLKFKGDFNWNDRRNMERLKKKKRVRRLIWP